MTRMLSFGQPLGAIMQEAHIVPDIHAAMTDWSKTLNIGPWIYFESFPLADCTYRGQPADLDISLGLAFSGSMCFELIQQRNDAPSVYEDVRRDRGYGFHHWAVSTTDFDASVRFYRDQGFEQALYGVAGVGARAAYMDTRRANGGMIELIELTDPVESLFHMVRQASMNWDGKNIIRPFDPATL
ncbi:VOC family protein [Yunchengibacter salinarum]|uniref:VOC family protein n=1 Tax=Yunchengibacter salinarum TaxID=3133399 RepID=UPI0035B5D248